ncbi:MAG: flagellar filament capping protein FliD [Acidobacteria bacterium]|nr:flagellar filament capping protein FliD [Acidobacteriota bacterium]
MGSTGGVPGGLDVQSIVQQILYAERAPARRMELQRSQLQTTDSAYSDLLSKLSDLSGKLSGLINGTFAAKTATSSNPNAFTATASPSAQVGLYNIKITSLASAGTYASNAWSTSTAALSLSGTFNVTLSGSTQTITVATTDSLTAIQGKINNAGLQATASIITDSSGSRLSVISNSTGAANDVTISANTVTGLAFTKTTTGADAAFQVNGISVTSASNTVSTVINGVTLNLLQADSTLTYSLSVASDLTSIKKSLNDFVSAYNALANYAKGQFAFDRAKNGAGVLAGDPALRQIVGDLQYQLANSYAGNQTYKTMASIGIEFQQDGTLAINDSSLSAALTANPTEVQNLFAASGSVGQNFNSSLTGASSPTSGYVPAARTGIANLTSDITKRIAVIDQRLAYRQQVLMDQFSRADAALRNLAILQNQISSQLRG